MSDYNALRMVGPFAVELDSSAYPSLLADYDAAIEVYEESSLTTLCTDDGDVGGGAIRRPQVPAQIYRCERRHPQACDARTDGS